MLDVGFVCGALNNTSYRVRRIIPLNVFVKLRYATGQQFVFVSLILFFLSQEINLNDIAFLSLKVTLI